MFRSHKNRESRGNFHVIFTYTRYGDVSRCFMALENESRMSKKNMS